MNPEPLPSDIVKRPKPKLPNGPRWQGGQPGHRCPACGKVVWAELSSGVIPDPLFGPGLQTLVGYMKGALHASYTRLEAFWTDVLDIRVTRAHLCNTIGRVNDALVAPYDELGEHIPTEPVLGVDESGWKDKGDRYWIWVFCTGLVSFFVIAKSRTLARRLLKHGSSIFHFLFDPAVPPTNNISEQAIRMPVIDRRITQGSRSEMGRQWSARIWTVLGTCRKQGRSAWQFLQQAVSAHYLQTPTPSLLPVQAR